MDGVPAGSWACMRNPLLRPAPSLGCRVAWFWGGGVRGISQGKIRGQHTATCHQRGAANRFGAGMGRSGLRVRPWMSRGAGGRARRGGKLQRWKRRGATDARQDAVSWKVRMPSIPTGTKQRLRRGEPSCPRSTSLSFPFFLSPLSSSLSFLPVSLFSCRPL